MIQRNEHVSGSTAEAPASAVTAGEVPAPYLPEESAQQANGSSGAEGQGPSRAVTEERSGRRRRLEYPPAPEPLPVPVFDNHAHLDFRDGRISVSVAEALDTAGALGVTGAICVGYNVESSAFAVDAAQADSRLKAAVAIHPNDAPELVAAGAFDSAFARIEQLSTEEQVVAVGETGLDYFRTGEDGVDAQKRSFAAHIELAVERDLAMQIHDRDAHDDVVAVLRDAAELPRSVVFHCFSGDAELARICNENGWYMSFAGTVTFANASGLREALAVADPQLLLVETDTPFLTPHPHRGQPNAPYMIPQTMRRMAEVRGARLEQLCQQIMLNTTQAYGTWT